MLYERIFPRWRPRDEFRPRGRSLSGAALRVEWLGTAGFVIRTETTTLLIDPFLSRPSLLRTGFTRLSPSSPSWLPEHVDAVLCGHSHYDHLLDAPGIAAKTQAKLCGSRTTCAFGRAAGVAEEQLVEVPASGRVFDIGDVTVRFVPSLHGRLARAWVPFPGEVPRAPAAPGRVWHYRMGGAFGIHLQTKGASLYHNGSADLVDAELAGLSADVLVVGLAGRKATRDYLGRLTAALSPKLIVPTHHDAFFAPLERGVHLLPGIDLDGFSRDAAAKARVMTPGYRELLAIPAGDAAGSVFAS